MPKIVDYSAQPTDPNGDEVEHAMFSQWSALKDIVADLRSGGETDAKIVEMILASKDLDAFEYKAGVGQKPPC